MKSLLSAPLRFGLGILLVYFVGAVLVYFFLGYRLGSDLARDTDRSLEEERNLLLLQYRDFGPAGLIRAIDNEIASEGSQSHHFRVVDKGGKVLHQAGALPVPVLGAFSGVRQVEGGGADGKISMRVLAFPAGDELTVFIASDLGAREWLMAGFRRTFILTAAAVALSALALGYWLSRRIRSRIDDFNRHTQLIVQSGDLSSRMPVAGHDEFSVLASNMNAMLERIERLVQGIRQVSDNIAHDLRTPLTRLRADVQVALQKDEGEAHREALARVAVELEKMQSIFNSLLAISRAESGGMPVKRAEVDFSELLEEMVELYTPSAEDHGLTLEGEVADNLLVYGNRQLLAQVLSNLLDNALKYVTKGGLVRVRASRDGNLIKVAVEDNGPGIPDEMRDKIFERFARIDPSRTMAGSGLGLSLAKAFIELHHGRIVVVRSELGGSAFEFELPAA